MNFSYLPLTKSIFSNSNHWFSTRFPLSSSHHHTYLNTPKMRAISKISLSAVWVVFMDIWKEQGHQKCTHWPFFALLYCLHFNYALLSELIGSLAKAIRSGGVRPDCDVLLDVYIAIHPADLRASLLNTSVTIIWVTGLRRLALLFWCCKQSNLAIWILGNFFLLLSLPEMTLHYRLKVNKQQKDKVTIL